MTSFHDLYRLLDAYERKINRMLVDGPGTCYEPMRQFHRNVLRVTDRLLASETSKEMIGKTVRL